MDLSENVPHPHHTRSEDDIRPEDDDRFYRHMRWWFQMVSYTIARQGFCTWCLKPYGTHHTPGCSYLVVTDRLIQQGYLSQESLNEHMGLIHPGRVAKTFTQIVDPASGEVIARRFQTLDEFDTARLLHLIDELWPCEHCPWLGVDWVWADQEYTWR
jgi:hypothetical protein